MYIGMFMAALSVVSCQEEWKDELYEQFASFKAVIGMDFKICKPDKRKISFGQTAGNDRKLF